MKMIFFNLFPCCIPVSGIVKATICDLQRDQIYPIPISLYDILVNFVTKGKSMQEIKKAFGKKNDKIIDEYFDYLQDKDLGVFSDYRYSFTPILENEYNDPKQITNAIIDYSSTSNHNIRGIISELSLLRTECLELRFFNKISINNLNDILIETNGSTLRSVEILIPYDSSYTLDNIIEIRKKFARIRKITLYGSGMNKILSNKDLIIIHTLKIIEENSCGVVSPWYFIARTENYIEAKKFNSCLNKKISIDQDGNIKNCPSMHKSYGHINSRSLLDVVRHSDFKDVWYITKDQIDVCKNCEYRYVCIDCRAFTVDNNLYSKPLKCKYNPCTGDIKI